MWTLLQAVQREYIARGATIGPDLPVKFESNSISLQLPSGGVVLEDGWKIIPLFKPEVEKCDLFIFSLNLIGTILLTDHQGGCG